MKLYSKILLGTLLTFFSFSAMAEDSYKRSTKLIGFQEAPPILSNGSGFLKLSLDKTGTTLFYTLTFSNLSSAATVSHIHFGHPAAGGAPIVFLCGGTKPACPTNGGTITGMIVASDILSVPAQGISPGNFNDLLAVIRSGSAYANVHTTTYPAGEIRGQIDKHSF
jgi:hypothetical protein